MDGMDKTKQTFNQSQMSERSSMMGNDIESLKKRTVKKILMYEHEHTPYTRRMSSMDKEVMKIFLKVLQVGSKYLNKEDTREKEKGLTNKGVLLRYGQTILDKERYRELEALLTQLAEEDATY